ncbi:hypothetical protein GOP47_0029501 [Adiantum capillus-veneris]|nr:hypothetical protein GOP47_0029501 [Adiantum capillus-veneris]
MPGNPQATVFIGNLDDKVDERVLYEIMVQAGPLVDIYVPRDKETKRHKGYAFAEFTCERSAQYAVSLFTGIVSLQKKVLRFSISGQDKQVNSQERPRPEGINISPLENSAFTPRMNSLAQISPGNFSCLAVGNEFSGAGQRLNFSPLAQIEGSMADHELEYSRMHHQSCS